jgi:hypothetical protein
MMAARRDLPDHRDDLRRALSDPYRLAEALGIDRSRTERHKWRCPRHGGTSLSIKRGGDGTLWAHCFGCDFRGDCFALIAEARGFSLPTEFALVLEEAADLAGMRHLVADRSESKRPAKQARPMPPRDELPAYPPIDEVRELWEAGLDPSEDAETAAMLRGRGLAPEDVAGTLVARTIPKHVRVPSWAAFKGAAWTETGHRLIVPVYDSFGVMRSVRAWRLVDADSPKRLPPKGFKAAGLILADAFGQGMLQRTFAPTRVLIAEGEPDFFTWATRPSMWPITAILGIVSGSWSPEMAEAVPSGATVLVRTHRDRSGDKYAEQINETLNARCNVFRVRGDT